MWERDTGHGPCEAGRHRGQDVTLTALLAPVPSFAPSPVADNAYTWPSHPVLPGSVSELKQLWSLVKEGLR